MKANVNVKRATISLLSAACVVLTACDEDAGEPSITIDTPTSSATYLTTAASVTIGGTVDSQLNYPPGMFVTNLRTGKRYDANTDNSSWTALIADLQLGENIIPATVLGNNSYAEANITVIRTQPR